MKILHVLFSMSVLSGCVVEAVVLAGAAITAPVWVPIEYGVSQANVKQPVEVVSTSGRKLSPDFPRKTETSLIVPSDAVICTGTHSFAKEPRSDAIILECNKGFRGRINFYGLTVYKVRVTLGPKSAPQKSTGEFSNIIKECKGNFNKRKDIVAAFLLECEDGRFGALSPRSADPDEEEFTVWLPPSS